MIIRSRRKLWRVAGSMRLDMEGKAMLVGQLNVEDFAVEDDKEYLLGKERR